MAQSRGAWLSFAWQDSRKRQTAAALRAGAVSDVLDDAGVVCKASGKRGGGRGYCTMVILDHISLCYNSLSLIQCIQSHYMIIVCTI